MTAAAEQPASPSSPAYGLRWGVKTSFIDYLRRMPDGRAYVSDGVVPVGSNELFFELDPDTRPTPESGRTGWAFRGDARFSGHFGMLFVRLARPWLVKDGEAAILSIEDAGAEEGPARIPLVTLTLTLAEIRENTEVWAGTDVRLTAQGVQLFNEVYAEGEPFEPLIVQVPAGS